MVRGVTQVKSARGTALVSLAHPLSHPRSANAALAFFRARQDVVCPSSLHDHDRQRKLIAGEGASRNSNRLLDLAIPSEDLENYLSRQLEASPFSFVSFKLVSIFGQASHSP
jgi:hypothetical protein